MSIRKSARGPVPFWLSVAGALLTLVGLLLVSGLSRAFAQNDVTPPTITSISITSDPDENDADLGAYSIGRSGGDIVQSSNWASGVYRIGDEVEVTVTFSEDVTVIGSPQLELAIGSSNRTAEYESTDGSAVVFGYTVAEGDTDSDGIAIGANKLKLNGGTIKDGADNDANLSHNALAAQDGHKVDGVRPRLQGLYFAASSGGSDGAYSAGETLIIRGCTTLMKVGTTGGVTAHTWPTPSRSRWWPDMLHSPGATAGSGPATRRCGPPPSAGAAPRSRPWPERVVRSRWSSPLRP